MIEDEIASYLASTDYLDVQPGRNGITTRDAALLVNVPEANVRRWKARRKLVLTSDGLICPVSLVQWYYSTRDPVRSKRNAAAATRRTPFPRSA